MRTSKYGQVLLVLLVSSIVSEQIGFPYQKNKDETFCFTTLYCLSDGKTLNAQ